MLPCGHNEACMYRYRHRGASMKYCFACIAEKFPEANINDMFKRLREKEEKKKEKKMEKEEKDDGLGEDRTFTKEHIIKKDENKQNKV
jgi:hypothetical protein